MCEFSYCWYPTYFLASIKIPLLCFNLSLLHVFQNKLSGKICKKKRTLQLQEINNVPLLWTQEAVNNGNASVSCSCPCQLEVYLLFIVIRYYPERFKVITVVYMKRQIFWDVKDMPLRQHLPTFRSSVASPSTGSNSAKRITLTSVQNSILNANVLSVDFIFIGRRHFSNRVR
jgi:hypothetical protein